MTRGLDGLLKNLQGFINDDGLLKKLNLLTTFTPWNHRLLSILSYFAGNN